MSIAFASHPRQSKRITSVGASATRHPPSAIMEPFPHRHSNSCNNLYNQSYGHREEQRTHRYVRRHLDDSSSACSEGRFMNGSNRDQAPSIHVCKSRTYDEDCSERSFQLGVDPIERDWGDSLSRDYRGTLSRAASLCTPTQQVFRSGGLLITLIAHVLLTVTNLCSARLHRNLSEPRISPQC